MDVSENGGTPKSSILLGFSKKNHPLWGTPNFGNTHTHMETCQVLNSYINQPPLNGDVAKVREKQMRLLQPPAPEDDWWPAKIVVSTRGSGADTERITERCCFFESETHLVNDQASNFLGFHT